MGRSIRVLVSVERLGLRPTSFRAGRWGFGPTVSAPLHRLGYEVDSSVLPYIDWTVKGGPDHTESTHTVYPFSPSAPFEARSAGSLVEEPASVGFMRGDHAAAARIRVTLERSRICRLRVVGHSSTLLPGATSFVRTGDERRAFLEALKGCEEYCAEKRLPVHDRGGGCGGSGASRG